eukprot:604163-Pelagomonas_calceolata.AAC.2
MVDMTGRGVCVTLCVHLCRRKGDSAAVSAKDAHQSYGSRRQCHTVLSKTTAALGHRSAVLPAR